MSKCPFLLMALLLGTLRTASPELTWPPQLPDGNLIATTSSTRLLKPPPTLRDDVEIARTPPRIEFLYYPGQDYPGKPWSNWGDGLAVDGKYYSAIGDHHSPRGSAYVYEYDARERNLRMLVNLREFLEGSGALGPDENYTPGKIHCRMEMGNDGWLYYAGHRGSTRTTNDANGFEGDWIFRTDPETGRTEIVAEHPVEKHVIPMSVLDPARMIFYGGTAPGTDAPIQDIVFFAYDIHAQKVRLAAPGGPARYAIFSNSNGCVYWDGRKYDPDTNQITSSTAPSVRSATRETPQGIVYGTTERSADLWAFEVETETLSQLGSGAVGQQEYITSIDADPTGRYLYYVPGAHGGSEKDGTPIVQFDVRTRTRKVIAFLDPLCRDAYGYTPIGTFSTALDPKGETLYVTWNGSRDKPDRQGRYPFDTCALTVVHIPATEREP